MHKRDALSEAIPHTGRGRWISALVAGLVAVTALIWLVASGFHGRHISSNAAALTAPVPDTTKTATPPSQQR
jgi:hypothetical protein